MVLIIMHHAIIHLIIVPSELNLNDFLIKLFLQVGGIANNIFFLITGYYMINKKINVNNIFRLLWKNIFYTYILAIIFVGIFNFQGLNLYKAITPTLSELNWFITAYVLLYISIPLINKIVNCITEKEYINIIIYGLIIFSILPSIGLLSGFFSMYVGTVLIYLIGGYLNKYKEKCKLLYEKSTFLCIFFIIALVTILILMKFIPKIILANSINNYFINFLISVTVFITCIKKKEYSNKFINYIAESVVAVYIIHDNFIIRDIIWKIIRLEYYYENKTFILNVLSISVMIFIICILIDKIQLKFIEKPIMKKIEKINYKIKKINS